MAGNSVVGALRVDLGLDSAQFTTGINKAQKGLAGFGKAAAVALAAVAAAATAASIALGHAVKGAIDHADELGKTAQKVGVTVEALSRLEYAAKLSDVSLDGLSTGLKKLSVNILAVAQGTGTDAKRAFDALRISIKNSDGTLRSSGDVMADVAERFSRMEDGAQKTALAVAIFGRAGADLIPLLNAGSDGLRQMADESDRVGATISTKTAKAAEQFNDTLTRLSQTFQGVVNKIVEAVLPALQGFADWLLQLSPEVLAWGTTLATVAAGIAAFGAAAAVAAPGVAALATSVGALATAMATLLSIPGALALLTGGIFLSTTTPVGAGEDAAVRRMNEEFEKKKGEITAITELAERLAAGERDAPGADFYKGMFGGGAKKPFVPLILNANEAKDATKKLKDELSGMNTLLDAQRSGWEQLMEPIRETFDTIGSGISDALGGVIRAAIAGKDAVAALTDSFARLGDRLIQMALDNAIQGLLGSLIGSAFGGGFGVGKGLTGAATYGFSGNGFFGLPSFDGGGFTGYGARTGGMDGKGGFPAILHPGETVLDNAKGGGDTRNYYITGSRDDGAAIARAIAREEAQQVVREYQQNPWRR